MADKPKRIIICDDEPDARDVTKMMLEKEGYSVDTVKDGTECLKQLKKERYDLLLLDIMMPGPTPKEIIAEIRKIKKAEKMKICYFSVVEFPHKNKKELLQEKNVVDYIQKPFQPEDFIRRIKKALAK